MKKPCKECPWVVKYKLSELMYENGIGLNLIVCTVWVDFRFKPTL